MIDTPHSGTRQTVRARWRLRCARWAATACLGLATTGCRNANYAETVFNDTEAVDSVMARVDRPTDEPVLEQDIKAPATIKTISGEQPQEYWDVTLDEVIGVAMLNSQVLRDLGATVLRAPQTMQTRYSRVLQQSDPRFGMEAALSAFDAQLQASAYFQDNDRIVNNRFLAGPNSEFIQDRHDYVGQISKLTATGTQLTIRNITDYDHNNAISNLFGNSFQTQVEGEVRQPLLQGAGLTFNRIAGPAAIPGVTNGVLVAKVNSDITAVDFERGLRDYVSDVVNAYWDLYFAYRDLDAKRYALSRARETWQIYQTQQAEGRESATAEALSREQFFRFQSDLQDAIAGKVGQRSQANNGVTGGVFRGVNGVQVAERRLRLLIGLPVTEDRTIRPIDDPEQAPVIFDWQSVSEEALRRRPELRAQRLLVKRRELELLAAENFLAPRLDAVATYRVRGLGQHLAGDDSTGGIGSAFSELGTFKYQEWAAGLEFAMPFGYRRAHAAVDNAEFLLARERAVAREQERQIVHDLSNQLAEADRAYEQVEINLNRYMAAQDALDSLEANRREELPVNLEQLLDVQRRLSDAQSRYYQARVEYAVALKNVHVEKGSILEYADLQMIDSTSPISSAMGGVVTQTAAGPKLVKSLPDAEESKTASAADNAQDSKGEQIAARERVKTPAEAADAAPVEAPQLAASQPASLGDPAPAAQPRKLIEIDKAAPPSAARHAAGPEKMPVVTAAARDNAADGHRGTGEKDAVPAPPAEEDGVVRISSSRAAVKKGARALDGDRSPATKVESAQSLFGSKP